MSHEYILWIATAAYAMHILEEYELNWRDWARNVLKLPVEWSSFYIVNALVIVLGICVSEIGWRQPGLALAFPALMIINATFFHVAPVIFTRLYSPGLFTALVLFYPVAIWTYLGASADGVLTTESIAVSFVVGAMLMAYPIVLLKIRHLHFFRHDKSVQ